MPCDRGHASGVLPCHGFGRTTMNFLKNLFNPSPQKVKQKRLRQTKLELIAFQEAAEYNAAMANMLAQRVERYEAELAAEHPIELKSGLRVVAA